ncbi:hypothetical protein [Nocardia tengchongensis]|uniref:hypothetical protein n=1 Tax=Nocardia tengchongensis TaxID=2055889 RepID=UPI00369C2866
MTENSPAIPRRLTPPGLAHDELVSLLQVITAYDNRSADAGTVAAWAEAARRQRWTFAEAIDAVHEHYSANTTWLMPGHVTQLIRRERGKNWQE